MVAKENKPMEYLLNTNMVTALMEENAKFLGHLQNLPRVILL